MHRFFLISLALLGVAISLGGCRAYRMGAPTMHRLEIRTIHIPVFESNSFRRFLGQQLTEAVVKQVQRDTPFVITGADRADSVLTGRIVRDSKRVLSESTNDDPRALQTEFQLEVQWTNRDGAPLMERQTLRLTRDVDFIPEGGQSLTTAQQELINRLAAQIVNNMEMTW